MLKYKIEFSFYSPLIYFTPPFFDSIVLSLAYKELTDTICVINKPNQTFGKKKLQKDIFWRINGIPVASWFIPAREEIYFDSWKKRFDSKNSYLIDWGKGKHRISVKQGKYRSYDMKMPGHAVRSGYFIFKGDGEFIHRVLFEKLFAIGKKRSMGFGIVDSFKMKEINCSTRDILKKRPIPVAMSKEFRINGEHMYIASRPPYWQKSNIEECVYHG